jgi:hypothetical protein
MIEKMFQRLLRMAKFDLTVYEEIENDENANVEALIIVVVSALLAALGSTIQAKASFGIFALHLVSNVLLRWLLWAYVAYFVGTRFFEGQTDFWEMARTLGYANAPMALGVLSIIPIPCTGWLVGLATWVLSIIIGFIAIREALDLPTDKTIITVVISGVIVFVIQLLLNILF